MNSLWDAVARPGARAEGGFHDCGRFLAIADLVSGSMLGAAVERLRGRSVLLATDEQLPTAVALLELDGVARRMVLCTPELTEPQLAALAATVEASAIVTDRAADSRLPALPLRCSLSPHLVPRSIERRTTVQTEWILLTSGTSGIPKPVLHTLESLADTLSRRTHGGETTVWSTFYDIRRYGGLQIYLRALLGGAPLVLSSPAEPAHEFLARATATGVSHISGTPSHWRRALMSGGAGRLRPRYVRLSGEVADQALLDSLRVTYPQARIAHAFASTEAGVAFDVDDGLAGFPAEFLDAHGDRRLGGVDLTVVDGTLRIRSRRTAARYLDAAGTPLAAADGFVDTGDIVERVAGRYYFRGRRGGVINVGGLKVYPEEVESVLNADSRVRMSLVRARRNPITGAIVVADVVLADASAPQRDPTLAERVKRDLLRACRQALAAHKVPVALRLVPALELSEAGKLVRPHG